MTGVVDQLLQLSGPVAYAVIAALVFAEASTRRDGNPFFEFLVQVARGNAEAAERIYGRLRELGYGADHVYGDHDVGQKLISDPAFAQFRTLWPPPAARR